MAGLGRDHRRGDQRGKPRGGEPAAGQVPQPSPVPELSPVPQPSPVPEPSQLPEPGQERVIADTGPTRARGSRRQPAGRSSGDGGPAGEARGRRAPLAGGQLRRNGDDGDSALRGLVGPGRSKISLSAAMRARDIAQPTADEIAEAERVIAERLLGRGGGDPHGSSRPPADQPRPPRPGARPSPGWMAWRGRPTRRDHPDQRGSASADEPAGPTNAPRRPGPGAGTDAPAPGCSGLQ